MDIKKIAILGAGNGGFMCAADFLPVRDMR